MAKKENLKTEEKQEKSTKEKNVVKVIVLEPIRHNEKRYEVGEEIELSKKEFDILNDKKIVSESVKE